MVQYRHRLIRWLMVVGLGIVCDRSPAQQVEGCFQDTAAPSVFSQLKNMGHEQPTARISRTSPGDRRRTESAAVRLVRARRVTRPSDEEPALPRVGPKAPASAVRPAPAPNTDFITRSAVWMEQNNDADQKSADEDQESADHTSTMLKEETPIGSLTIDIAPRMGERQGERIMPADLATQTYGSLDQPTYIGTGSARPWEDTYVCWSAPSFYHRPLYFEQPNLERYGHYHGNNLLQSAVSAAHFFGSVWVLPYKVGASPWCDCHYTLGRCRPGDCVAHRLERPEISPRGIALQAAVTTGAVFVVP
jgi:hypothetical protein